MSTTDEGRRTEWLARRAEEYRVMHAERREARAALEAEAAARAGAAFLDRLMAGTPYAGQATIVHAAREEATDEC